MQRKFGLVALMSLALLLAVGCAVKFARPVGAYLSERFIGHETRPQNEIVLWHAWGGTQKELLEKVIREFEEYHPGIRVKPVFCGAVLSNSQKFFTSVAAGKSPDLVFVDGTQVAEWASQGALQPLDRRVREAVIKPQDFFTPCWKQCNYNGCVWALTYCVDPNFAWAWNKSVFREAGLDPDKPPQTIAELDRMNDKLTRRHNGSLVSMGVIPTGLCGSANSLYTWGWAFGGEFYDEKRRRITANDPKVVKALEWMCSYAKKYDITKISSMSQGFGSLDKNPFYTGQIGMTGFHITFIDDARTYAPTLDYGLGDIPYPPGGEPHSSWIGGWCIAMPRESKHPELGWKLMKWLCATKEGTTVVGNTQDLFPGYRKSPYFDSIGDDPRYGKFLEILRNCKHQRPVMPAEQYLMGALDRAVEAALYGLKTPKQALDDATAETQHELDLRLASR
ncbi:MAG: ABC transporter substrate-binding protein [Armatimonadota bacterium]